MSQVFKIEHRKDIQLLRGFSVLAVIFFHLDKNFFSFGYLGVDIFFAISGFVISNLIFAQLDNNKFKFKEFIFLRFKRIVPSLIAYLIFVQILSYFNLDHNNIVETAKTSIYSLFFLANIHLSRYLEYFAQDTEFNLVINLWSLSVEEQFYIIFPIFAFLIFRFKNRVLILLSISLFSILALSPIIYNSLNILEKIFLNYNNYIFYSPLTRVWEFLFGVIAMFANQKIKLKTKNKKLIDFFILILLFTTFLPFININNFTRQFLALFITSIILSINASSILSSNFFNNFFIFTGNISYSLYLFHQGVISSIKNHNHYSTEYSIYFINLENKIIILFVILVIYIISYFNFLFVEEKYRKIKKYDNREFFPFFSLLFILSFLFILNLNTNGYSFRSSELSSFNQNSEIEYLPGTNYLTQDGKNCLNRESLDNLCEFQSIQNNTKIYIIGDSQISSLVGGFLTPNILKNYNIIELTKGGCPLLIDRCNFYNETILYNSISNIEESLIILGGRYQKYFTSDPNNKDSEIHLLDTIKFLTKNNNTVFFLSPIPEPGINERMYYLKNKSYPKFLYEDWLKSVKKLNSALEKYELSNFHIINIESIFCTNRICNFKNDEFYYFLDHVHFSYYGSRKVADKVIDSIINNS
jgi:peptidoglycan/LPS O-acetylase OafA/YrhL